MASIKGKRILIVEDEALVALMLEDMLTNCGAVVVGSKSTIGEGSSFAKEENFDVAVLDVNVHGSKIDPIIDILTTRGIPYLLATGYEKVELPNGHNPTSIQKPYSENSVIEGLAKVLAASEAPRIN
jgi:CheY-like chemotaxis protein